MKPVSSLYLLLLLLSGGYCSYGQGENNVWCFGYHQGLDFNTGPPILYYDSIRAAQGCVTVNDANGNLLFYASPENVWDRNHNIMPNGSGLLGNYSATEGAAVIHSFNNPNQYYLFTLTAAEQLNQQLSGGYLYYSVVDISLNNGFGDVVAGQKNILLDSIMSEKMNVAKGINCNWLMVHRNVYNEFHAYKIDNNGLNTSPVISVAGDLSHYYEVGAMVFSPNYNRIGLVNFLGVPSTEIYSFDNITGGVYDYQLIDAAGANKYGACFSPDGNKFYTSDFSSAKIFQFDLSLLPDAQAVTNSKVLISSGDSYLGMRMGPDSKIYVSTNTMEYISVIDSPNNLGLSCHFLSNVFGPLNAHYDYGYEFGTPVIPDCPPVTMRTDTTICFAQGPQTINAPAGYVFYKWNDSSTQQTHIVQGPGIKWVYCYGQCSILVDTFAVVSGYTDTAKWLTDTSICFASPPISISGPIGYDSYVWSDGLNEQQDTFNIPGIKWLYSGIGCHLVIDTFKVNSYVDTIISVIDTSHCVAYSPITIYAPGGYSNYLWNDGCTSQADTFFITATKWVTAESGCDFLIDTVHFTATTIPPDSVATYGGDTTVCFDSIASISINGPGGYSYYLWNDGSTESFNVFDGTGTKWVYAQKLCYLLIDTFKVQFVKYPHVDLGPDMALCNGQSIVLDATSAYTAATYLWQDGKTGPTYSVTSGGDYSVQVSLGPCSVSDTVRVHEKVIDIKLGSGLIPCRAESITLDAGVDSASYLWQDGSTGRTIKVTKEATYSVKVTEGDCSASASVDVRFEGCPCNVVLPTAFSPNGDGKNDKFGAKISCDIGSYKLMVYNRWGNRVFYSEDISKGWDGTSKGIALDGDVFNYYLEFKDGENKVYYYKGTVTLVR